MNIFDSHLPQPGARATETAHRKIELQAPADLTYLIANLSRAAREKLDKHLPPDAVPEGGEDAMRKRVEELVDEVRAVRLRRGPGCEWFADWKGVVYPGYVRGGEG